MAAVHCRKRRLRVGFMYGYTHKMFGRQFDNLSIKQNKSHGFHLGPGTFLSHGLLTRFEEVWVPSYGADLKTNQRAISYRGILGAGITPVSSHTLYSSLLQRPHPVLSGTMKATQQRRCFRKSSTWSLDVLQPEHVVSLAGGFYYLVLEGNEERW